MSPQEECMSYHVRDDECEPAKALTVHHCFVPVQVTDDVRADECEPAKAPTVHHSDGDGRAIQLLLRQLLD